MFGSKYSNIHRSRSWRTQILVAAITIGASASAHAQCTGTDILPALRAAQPEVLKTVRTKADRIINTNAIFWRIEKSGITPSYLFGTMHVSDPRIRNMPTDVQNAIKSSRTVALELADMSPTATIGAVAQTPGLIVYTDGSRLDQKLTTEEFAKTEALLGKAGIPAQMASVMRPWLVSVMMALPECEQKSIASGKVALDQAIGNLARSNGIDVVGLETAKMQFEAFANVPDTDQIAMLRTTLAFSDKRDDLFETLIQAYLRRDLGIVMSLSGALAKIAGLSESGFASFSANLLKKRNHTMFQSSRPLVDAGGSFIAVGAAHLIDETGLVALYRKAGFTVTALR